MRSASIGTDIANGRLTPTENASGRDVDVIIPVHCPGDWLTPCLASVFASRGVDVGVIVVDNSGPHDPPAERPAPNPALTWLAIGKNLGFSAACNRGIAVGSAPFVLCLNQDARVSSDFLVRLLAIIRDDATIGAASGKVLHVPGALAVPDGQIDTMGIEMRTGRRGVDIGQGALDDGSFDGRREVFGVSGAVALYRRAALAEVAESGQVFDERFFMYKEDVDLAWRLRAAGYRSVVDSFAVAYHGRSIGRQDEIGSRGASARRLWVQERHKPAWARHRAWRNQILMLIKNERVSDFGRSAADLALRELVLLGVGLGLDPLGTLAARVKILRELPEALRRRRAARRVARVRVSGWLP